MEERIDRSGPQLERLRPGVDGGAFRRPPILPVVSMFMLFLGLGIGFRLAPAPGPALSPSIAAAATRTSALPTPTDASTYSPSWDANGPFALTYTLCVDADGLSGDPTNMDCGRVVRVPNADVPPADSISIEEAIAAAKAGFGIETSEVISAQLTDYSGYVPQPAGEGRWVWELRIRNAMAVSCGGGSDTSRHPGATPELCVGAASVVIVIDAMTGEAISMTSVAYP